MEILWKDTVSSQFRAIRPKLCGNCVFPQNFHTMKLGEITVFYAVKDVYVSDSTAWILLEKHTFIFVLLN